MCQRRIHPHSVPKPKAQQHHPFLYWMFLFIFFILISFRRIFIHYQSVTRSFRRTFYFFRQANVFLRHGFVRWLYFFPPLFGFQRSHHFVQGRRIESIPFYNKKRRIQRINASKQVLQTMNTKPFPCAVIIHIRFIGYNLSRTENVQHPSQLSKK